MFNFQMFFLLMFLFFCHEGFCKPSRKSQVTIWPYVAHATKVEKKATNNCLLVIKFLMEYSPGGEEDSFWLVVPGNKLTMSSINDSSTLQRVILKKSALNKYRKKIEILKKTSKVTGAIKCKELKTLFKKPNNRLEEIEISTESLDFNNDESFRWYLEVVEFVKKNYKGYDGIIHGYDPEEFQELFETCMGDCLKSEGISYSKYND